MRIWKAFVFVDCVQKEVVPVKTAWKIIPKLSYRKVIKGSV